MKKRILSFVLVFLIISVTLGYSSDALFSKIDIPKVGVEKDSERVSSEGLTRYVYGAGLVASVKDSEIKYHHSDRIQSNRLVTDSSGSVEKEFKSLPFGQEISNSGVKYAFATGKELDESDLYYFGARYYDSDLGRFTSVDPVKENEPYSYVRNNPLNLVDPNGKDQETIDYTWTAPTEGTPVEHYVVQIQFGNEDWTYFGDVTTEAVSVTVNNDFLPDNPISIKVAGVDIDGGQGPYSEASNYYYGGNEHVSGVFEIRAPEINIYPNPSSSIVSIDYYLPDSAENGIIEIYDLKGRIITQTPLGSDYGEGSTSFEVGDMASGVYNMIFRYVDMEGESTHIVAEKFTVFK